MMRIWAAIAIVVLSCGVASGEVAAGAADGIIQLDPPQALGCLAVRVEVPEDQMITGLRWYNGTDSEAFPRILVASGNGYAPPAYGEAVAVADSVTGNQADWTEIAFSDPVASQSGTLFVIMQYPDGYVPQPGQLPLGVGYANEETDNHYFVTGDGSRWMQIASRCRVLLEPVLDSRDPDVIALRARDDRDANLVKPKFALFAAPNPFNPETHIEFSVPAAAQGDVKVFDIRGRLVAELHNGALAQGQNSFVWRGRDRSGRTVASGAYWIKARAGDKSLVRKLLLLK